jgi:hypothetical protein
MYLHDHFKVCEPLLGISDLLVGGLNIENNLMGKFIILVELMHLNHVV